MSIGNFVRLGKHRSSFTFQLHHRHRPVANTLPPVKAHPLPGPPLFHQTQSHTSKRRVSAEGPLSVLGRRTIFMVSLTFGGDLVPLLWEIARYLPKNTWAPVLLPFNIIPCGITYFAAKRTYFYSLTHSNSSPVRWRRRKWKRRVLGNGEMQIIDGLTFQGFVLGALEVQVSLCLSDSAPPISS